MMLQIVIDIFFHNFTFLLRSLIFIVLIIFLGVKERQVLTLFDNLFIIKKMIDKSSQNNISANEMSFQNPVQPSPTTPISSPKKPNVIIIYSIVLLVLLLVTSVISYVFKFYLKSTKNTPTPTPTTIIFPSPTIILKEEYVNPFAPTGTSDKQYSNPFEQTNNPFDELAK